jgi:hypothetical protein
MSRQKVPTARTARLEPLETRRLFSNINWVNEGNDSFIFFGANQNLARDIVHKAISDWERVIVDFNYDDTGSNLNNTFNLTLSAASMPFGTRGGTTNTGHDDNTDRKPTSAAVTIDDDASGLGWYFDPNVFDDGEFTEPINLFAANAPFPGGPSGNDFYRTVLHEIGHAVGISLSTSLKLRTKAVNTGIADPFDTDQTLWTLQTFGGPDPEYTLTDKGGAHLWEGDGVGGVNLSEHPDDLMNDGRTVPGGVNRRQLISDYDALLLRDVYNYQIVAPSQINTFVANLNESTGVLTINGDIGYFPTLVPTFLPNDFIDLEYSGVLNLTVQLGNGSLSSEPIPDVLFSSVVINSRTGDDTIEINGLPPNKTVTVNLGEGDDGVVFGGEGRFMSSIQSNVTMNGGTGSNGVTFRDDNNGIGGSIWTINNNVVSKSGRNYTLNDVPFRWLYASTNFNNTFLVNSTPVGTTLNLIGNNGSEAFELGNNNLNANIRGTVNVTGGGGSDFLRLNDLSATSDADWTFNGSLVAKDSVPLINYQSLEGITANGGSHKDQFKLFATNAPVAVRGNSGDDEFYISSGDLDRVSRVTVDGGAGNDLLVLDDSTDIGDDSYLVTAAAITKPGNPEAFQAVELNTQIGLETERTILIANDGSNSITVNGGRGVEVKARAGGDLVTVNDHVPGSPVLVDTGDSPQMDAIDINADGVGTVTAELRNSDVLAFLNVRPGGRLNVAAGSNAMLDVKLGLSLDGLLDLNDNTMIARVTAGGGSVDYFRTRLASARNGGAWNGTTGITSTTAANSALPDGIGYASAAELGRTEFSGVPISGSDLVLRQALYGDTDLNGRIDFDDYVRTDNGFNTGRHGWINGDFDYNNKVNFDDYVLIDLAFNSQ